MRVLVTTSHWGVIGGSERYAAELVPHLVERGHEVTVLAGAASAPALHGTVLLIAPDYVARHPDREQLAAALASLPPPDVILTLSSASDRGLRALLESVPAPQVRFVQDHVPFCPGLNKLHADGARCTSAMGPVCLERYLGSGCAGFRPAVHGGDTLAPLTAFRKHLRGLDLLRGAARVVVASAYMRGELRAVGIEAECVPYLTPTAVRARPDEHALENHPPLLLTPARLTLPDKGVDFLLTALGKLRHPFRAVIAGSGPAESYLRSKAQAEGLADRVRFTGWLEAEALARLYARARAVVVPSVWDEPFGLVGLEAMSHGRAVAAFDVGGIAEWLADGVTGRLVPARDTDALAAVLEPWLEDATEPERMGRAGRLRAAERFAPGPHVDRMEALLALAAQSAG